jgi:hypothetical protein
MQPGVQNPVLAKKKKKRGREREKNDFFVVSTRVA